MFNKVKMGKLRFNFVLLGLVIAQLLVVAGFAQTGKKKPVAKKPAAKVTTPPVPPPLPADAPKVTQIDLLALQGLLKREADAKPLLINFWATWCDPCREEFPDLVKLDADYKGKIDFITISLDELEELNAGVPRFLYKVKSTMPAYLLKVPDEGEAIQSVSKAWNGGLPFTMLIDSKGASLYSREGKVILPDLRKELDKVTQPQTTAAQ